MAYRVVRSKQSNLDLDLIFDHLLESYLTLGDTLPEALDRAANRIRSIEDDMQSIASAPFQGTAHPDLLPGLRHVTKNRAIFYFSLEEATEEIRILAVFFGGQDHQRRMLTRISGG